MKVDVRDLETFNRLAREGASAATESLARMTGIDATVEVTRVSLADRAEVGREVEGSCGVQFGFDGAISGETVLAFDERSTAAVTEALVPGGGMRQSAIEELGNVMMSGFIDGWAAHLGGPIEHTPPTYAEGSGGDLLPEPEGDRDQLFVFRSEIEGVEDPIDFAIYMLPEPGSLATAVDPGEEAIPVEKLEVFNRMTREGTRTAAENIAAMAGIEVEAEVTQLSFCPIEDVPKQVAADAAVGTVVEFDGTPSGYLLVLFDEASAERIAGEVMPVPVEGEGLTDLHESAIEELGNIVTSGFIDGWANVLRTSIEHEPPRLVRDMGRAIVDPVAAQLGQHQRHAFVVDSTLCTPDVAVESEIYVLPDGRELRRALEELHVDRADQTEADPETIFE